MEFVTRSKCHQWRKEQGKKYLFHFPVTLSGSGLHLSMRDQIGIVRKKRK
jgi:hypothetical protein